MDLREVIRTIPDFPEEGVLFRDITPILQDPKAFKASIDKMKSILEKIDFDIIIGPESRGFIFSTPLAYVMGKSFVPVRKEGKLPYEVIRKSYDMEYGSNTVEIHKDAIKKGQKVVIVDDLLATGGTCKAVAELLEEIGAEVTAMLFLVELQDLKGREVLKDYNVKSIVKY